MSRIDVKIDACDGSEYVLFPACAYDGNRFKAVRRNYPPLFTPEEADIDMEITITDVPGLNKDGSGKIQVTTGHVATFKELSVGDEIRRLKDKIQVFHVHDTIYEKDVHLFPYDGVINWMDFAKALKDINYKGVFSLETQPSGKLPEDIFEDMSKLLVRIAKDVTNLLE